MDTITNKVKEAVDKGVSFDLEVLLDELVEASKQINNNQKESLHSYDNLIHTLVDIIQSEINYLKTATASETSQHTYKTLKLLLNILNEIPTVF
jgi:FtsZ-binding cell division protein ZapB